MGLTPDLEQQIWQKINSKTKPPGSLGKLEHIAAQIATIQQTLEPRLENPAILVFAADHGVAELSPYPQEVTWQMVMNFLAGGAAINVFCRQNNIALKIIDAGVNYQFPPGTELIDRKIACGSRNFLSEPAMSEEELMRALNTGAELMRAEQDCNIIGFGEMGIGNSSSAAMLMSEYCNIAVEDCVGRGAGLDDAGFRHKQKILKEHVHTRRTKPAGPQEILRYYGGYEIAMMTGGMIEAAKQKKIILVDGFIASAANLAACKFSEEVKSHSLYTHLSAEQGHALMLEHLGVEALLNIGMRLGEGSGAAIAYSLIQSAVAFFNEMASFDTAGISDRATGSAGSSHNAD